MDVCCSSGVSFKTDGCIAIAASFYNHRMVSRQYGQRNGFCVRKELVLLGWCGGHRSMAWMWMGAHHTLVTHIQQVSWKAKWCMNIKLFTEDFSQTYKLELSIHNMLNILMRNDYDLWAGSRRGSGPCSLGMARHVYELLRYCFRRMFSQSGRGNRSRLVETCLRSKWGICDSYEFIDVRND